MPLLRGPEIDFPGRKLNIHGLRQRQLAASNMLKELLIGHLLRSACPGRRGGHPRAFTLDDHHLFVTDKPMLVCGNTADMIGKSRYARDFNVSGDKLKHFGLFDCSTPRAGMTQGNAPLGACC